MTKKKVNLKVPMSTSRQTPSGKRAYEDLGKRLSQNVRASVGSVDFTSGMAVDVASKDYQVATMAPRGPRTLANGKQLNVDLNAARTYVQAPPQQNAPESSNPTTEAKTNMFGNVLKIVILGGVAYAVYYVFIRQ